MPQFSGHQCIDVFCLLILFFSLNSFLSRQPASKSQSISGLPCLSLLLCDWVDDPHILTVPVRATY